MKLTIVGAGLAGSLLAVFLARRGFEVTMLERRADMRKSGVVGGRSINLALASRGIVGLQRAGLFESLKPILMPMPGRMMHDQKGELLYQQYSKNAWEFNWSASRGGLNIALMDAAEATGRVEILFNQRVDNYDFTRDALVVFDEREHRSRRVEAPVVIATDGAGSPMRDALDRTWGNNRESDEPLDHAYKELLIPPGPGGEFRMRNDALHIWPRGGHMMIALPNPDGTFTCTLFMARHGHPSFDDLRDEASVRAFFRAEFADAVPLMPTLARDFFENPPGMLGTVRCDHWTDGKRVLLLGDAAHAIVPFHGQGMNCAFEDCVAFDDAVEQFGTDWPRVFTHVERERKPNANAIADMAIENYIEMRDLVRDPRFHLRKKVEFLLEDRHPDRFIPRYSMVMYHPEITYAEAQSRGAIQLGILEELTAGIDDAAWIDLAKADSLVKARLSPLETHHFVVK